MGGGPEGPHGLRGGEGLQSQAGLAEAEDPGESALSISVVIPVHNEEESILGVLNTSFHALEELGVSWEVIVVDDGSTDETYRLLESMAEQLPLKIVRNRHNSGKASAVLKGLRQAEGDIIVIMDGDGQHLPPEIPHLLTPILEGEASAVLGSRFLDSRNNIPLRHRAANRVITKIFNLLYGTEFSDVLFGFRAFRRDVVKDMDLRRGGYLIEVEAVAELLRAGVRVEEVPATCLYREVSPIARGLCLTAQILLGIIHFKFSSLLRRD